MDLLRAILDGIMMSVVFNALVTVAVLIDPRYFLDSYPKSIQQAAPRKMTRKERTINTYIMFLVLVPLLLYGGVSSWHGGIKSFRSLFMTGYIHWILVNFGDFFFLDILFFQKLPDRVAIPGTEGHRDYALGNWMKALGLKEHFLLWPLILVPLYALLEAAIVWLLHFF